MVTMLVPRTEKIPLFTDVLGENTPYFSQNEDFCCKKNHPFFRFQGEHRKITPFFRFQGEHIAWWSLLKQIEDIRYSCNTFFFIRFSSCLLAVVTLEHYISWKCKAIGNNLSTQFSALTWSLTLQGLQRNVGPPKNIPFCAISRSWSKKKYPFLHISKSVPGARNPPLSRCF